MNETIIKEKRVLLVGVEHDKINDMKYSMDELRNLVEAADYEIVDIIIQKLDHPHRKSYVGSGKVQELQEAVDENNIDVIVCNDELSPLQLQTLDDEITCEILDRTTVILEIFSKRAKTKEAKLQVEISYLEYQLPRLIGARSELGRQAGTSGGMSNRGAGETQLELDRRYLVTQIQSRKRALKELVEQRKVARRRRSKQEVKTVALVGYTNAGKSSILNALLQEGNENKEVFVKDMLFATLETRAREVELSHKQRIVVSDTVGFVDKLPHHLVKAFRSTLEEIQEADLLLHVIDYSNPYYAEQMATTNAVLKDMGVDQIPILNVYNKMDKTEEKYPYRKKHKVFLSATSGGIDMLLEAIEETLYPDMKNITLRIPFQESGIVSKLHEKFEVVSEDTDEEATIITIYAPNECQVHYEKYIVV